MDASRTRCARNVRDDSVRAKVKAKPNQECLSDGLGCWKIKVSENSYNKFNKYSAFLFLIFKNL